MNKKILIGSIMAVAILVGVSLTFVVGYQSIESDFRESPLFNMRSGRAIKKDSNDATCNYFGKGKVNNVNLKERNSKAEMAESLINTIRKIDEKSLHKLAYLITYYDYDEAQELDYEDIFQSLIHLRDTPEEIIKNIPIRKDSIIMSDSCTVFCTQYFELECLGFIIVMILVMLYVVIAESIIQILSLLTI